MAQSRGKQRIEPETSAEEPAEREDAEEQERLSAIPELMRRAIALGSDRLFHHRRGRPPGDRRHGSQGLDQLHFGKQRSNPRRISRPAEP